MTSVKSTQNQDECVELKNIKYHNMFVCFFVNVFRFHFIIRFAFLKLIFYRKKCSEQNIPKMFFVFRFAFPICFFMIYIYVPFLRKSS